MVPLIAQKSVFLICVITAYRRDQHMLTYAHWGQIRILCSNKPTSHRWWTAWQGLYATLGKGEQALKLPRFARGKCHWFLSAV